MKNILIYSKGKLFQKYYNLLNNVSIIAIIDKNAQENEEYDKIPVYKPNRIVDIEYDYIIIFSDAFFNEIVSELVGSYFVDKTKIVSWKIFMPEKKYISKELRDILVGIIQENNIKSILCIGGEYFSSYFMSKSQFGIDTKITMDNLKIDLNIKTNQLFDNNFLVAEECKREYDLVLITDINLYNEEIYKNLEATQVIIISPFCINDKENNESTIDSLKTYFLQKYYLTNIGVVQQFVKKPLKNIYSDYKIYVVTHKEYNVLSDELYTPIYVGNNQKNKKYLLDCTHDNIAYLNAKINECTALYWIWKNTTDKIVGLNHYRRYFYSNRICYFGNYLNSSEIEYILNEYDLILPQADPFYNLTIKEQLIETIPNKFAFEEGYEIIKRVILDKQPTYLEAFDAVMESHNFYKCNMFVTKREILNDYCEWLFSFLIEAAERIDVSTYDNYSKRVIGFFAERMLTVWLYKNPLKIKELPIALW